MEEVSAETRAEAEMEAEDSAPNESPDVTVKVENVLPENVPAYYSDAVTVLHSAHEFVISFLQTEFPLALSKEELQQIKVVKRKCIARVFMTPAQFEAFTKVCTDQVDKYIASYRKP